MMESIHVLYVDDDPTSTQLVEPFLHSIAPQGKITTAGTRPEAETLLASGRYDLILLHLTTSSQEGFAFLDWLQHSQPQLPVIALSSPDQASQARGHGAREVFTLRPEVLRYLPAAARDILAHQSQTDLAGQLRAREARLRELLMRMGRGLFVYTPAANETDFIITEFIPSALRKVQSDPAEMIGKTLLEIFPRAVELGLLRALQRVARTGQAEHFPMRIVMENQEVGWRENLIYRLPDGEVVASYEDITDRKRTEEEQLRYRMELEEMVAVRTAELAAAKQRAEDASRAKSAFLSAISHEIRTPLNGILGLAQLTLATDLTASQRHYLSRIAESGEILLAGFNQILTYADLEIGKFSLRQSAFALSGLLEALEARCRPRAQEKELEFVMDIPGDLPGPLVGDPLRLAQVLANLLDNAIKFTPTGAVTLALQTSISSSGDALLEFSVSDTGLGMTGQTIDGLFEPFTQADTSVGRAFEGMGLSLAISRRLVELMDGTIHVVSQPGQGTTFFVTLPLALAAQHEPELFTDWDRLDSDDQEMPVTGRLDGQRILLVEDNEINQIVAADMLKRLGAQVAVASGGLEALESVARESFDVILMDLQMPHMDGYQTTASIRAMPELTGKSLPIIAVTASTLIEDRERAMLAGIDDFLSKPLDERKLFGVIARWCAPSQLPSGPTAAVPPQPPGVPGRPHLPGLDSDKAIERLGGNVTAFIALARKFAATQQHADTEIQAALAAGDFDRARLLAHTIKGVAGYLGATVLAENASAFEKALTAGQPQPAFQAFQKEHQRVLEVIAHLPDADQAVPVSGSGSDQFEHLYERLKAECSQSNTAAVATIAELISQASSRSVRDNLTRIQNAVQQYDFKRALEELNELEQRKIDFTQDPE